MRPDEPRLYAVTVTVAATNPLPSAVVRTDAAGTAAVEGRIGLGTT